MAALALQGLSQLRRLATIRMMRYSAAKSMTPGYRSIAVLNATLPALHTHRGLTVLGKGGDDSANITVRLDSERLFAKQRDARKGLAGLCIDDLVDLRIDCLPDCASCR
jgi:hypothetical protein